MESTTETTETLPGLLDDLSWFCQGLRPLERSILLTLSYADLFDYPLSHQELHRYLIGNPATPHSIQEALGSKNGFSRVVTAREGLITLAEREEIIETRRRRAGVAADFWQGAIRYGRIIARLPFVRMVAVTGALAMDNVDEDGDIDYLIVTEPGRLWLSRAWCILLVRIAGMVGSRICPNYFLTTRALRDLQRSLYSAHEISQMIPISGGNCYQELRSQNRWV
ncbi:MAG TPA: hypothetical protein VJ768_09275, partial [Anaerolineales bacterium]|nr:hypothetical protein [Anaerolineales bacterium]